MPKSESTSVDAELTAARDYYRSARAKFDRAVETYTSLDMAHPDGTQILKSANQALGHAAERYSTALWDFVSKARKTSAAR